VSELAVTKLDILSGMECLQLCTAYRFNGQLLTELPLVPADLDHFEPVYDELPGWSGDISAARNVSDLPPAAIAYLDRLVSLTGIPVRLVSVGPEREQVVKY